MPLTYGIERVKWTSARCHKIFRDDLDKIHWHIAGKKIGVMIAAQAKAEAVKGCDVVGHEDVSDSAPGRVILAGCMARQPMSPMVPPRRRHMPAASALKPWPLQLFMPLQSCAVVLQSEWPLQLLTP